jgi:hypothetical protein
VNKKLKTIIICLAILVFITPILLPRQLFGKWNAISKLDEKNITGILLKPSEPNWNVNLVSHSFLISDKDEIHTLVRLLQKSEVYFPSHPARIWETKMIFIDAKRDSFEVRIEQTENNGTAIYTTTNHWRKDPLGHYLESITSYKKPACSDMATIRY